MALTLEGLIPKLGRLGAFQRPEATTSLPSSTRGNQEQV